jgi:3-methyladenine DNA glycosylase Tag
MKDFADLYAWAAKRKGGEATFEPTLPQVKTADELAAIGDDRWLAGMTKKVFQAGFNWSVIEKKWDGFEEAFEGFDPARWTMMSDDDLDRLLGDTRIVRHAKKILSVRDNAIFLRDLAAEHGTAARVFAHWPESDFVGLLDLLKRRASRLSGTTAQYFLRSMGKDSFVLGKDVVTALVREGVVAKAASSKRDLQAVQEAFNHWREQSGRPLAHISKVLACTVES